ncbi:hypothetical protein ACFQBQ_00445 [Granulicella cerasi]|uniref:CBM6 domain-containing protein n=1 Tax=Granulicella cerasi TaxID=741063 RepID=A0ABW1Z3E8_9BACT|nr:hypothetical protein [Granulicella cerasi]
MKNTIRIASIAILSAASFAANAQATHNNWRAEHSRDKVNSTNVTIDDKRGLDSTGTPAKAVWVRQFPTAGKYMLKLKYTPIAGRAMKVTINGQEISTKGLNAKPKDNPDMDCEKAAWRELGEVKFNEGANTIIMEPIPADGKLPHVCQFDAELE